MKILPLSLIAAAALAGLGYLLLHDEISTPASPASASAPADPWTAAIAAIAASPRYGGLQLSPQHGLVPIGPDARSGLWEFWHRQSGAPPLRDPQTGTERVGDTTGIVFVLIPGGTFTMGAQSTDPAGPNFDPLAAEDERPNRVTIGPYFLSKYELTQGQWFRLVGSRPSRFDAANRGGESHPVEYVDWKMCMQTLGGFGLTLPTEAQWEFAARAGTTTPWWSGDTVDSIGEVGENLLDATAKAHPATKNWDVHESFTDGYLLHSPVGHSRPNAFGLFDVIGNVREWCLDRYGSYDLPVREGDGLRMVPEGEDRVIRGGCFRFGRFPGRSSNRLRMEPGHTGAPLGVRPARLLDPPGGSGEPARG